MKVGSYALRIEMDGYEPWEETILVQQDQATDVLAKLIKIDLSPKGRAGGVGGNTAPKGGGNGLIFLGSGGVILKSTDTGETWTQLPIVRDSRDRPAFLRRVRFFGDQGWAVGPHVVLKQARNSWP